ncbi:hypothetical protein FPZ42_01665 [Mucilaginibacter achroorhodeus]|uniref:Glycosyltransferase RgtA/B/C/D-like domain-containing protein n=1 Tax=Mucilaginibacter achroorhodeus TaxID=2599294 RepID=A0A563U9K3_9SPHI|nr:hypothetical protein [Mucilaginibacter achroorhodeus]TWR27949.1 hypothetical protein FPZ42_01665 [Mucilaginibacter achroorhodeus]
MFLRSGSAYKIILSITFILIAIPCALLLLHPAAIFPDASWGFQVWRSMQNGSGFNMITQVSHTNIATNVEEFKSWWSPGQYLVPGAFQKLFGLDLGHASSLTTIICQFSGLAGLYAFFKKAGFSKIISALSILIIALQQSFLTPFIFYNGGEVLLFGFIGWFLYGCLSFTKPGIVLVVFVLLSGWIGFFAKSSFLWMYGAGLLFIWIKLSKHTREIKTWLVNGLWIGVPAVISFAVIYLTYISRGVNPSSASGGLDFSLKVFAFPLASPLLAGFSFDDIANGFIFHNDAVIFSPGQAVAIIAILAIVSLLLIYFICKKVPNKRYAVLLAIFYAAAVLFFGSAFLRKLDISFEARHFRTVGLLTIPGAVYLFSRAAKVYRIAFGLMVAITAFFGLKFYILSHIALRTEAVHSTSGIAQQFADKETMDYLRMLDNHNNNAVFVFFSPDMGLEINHNRSITLDPLGRDISINMDDYTYKGHGGPVYILMPHNYIGIRANVLLKCFPGYKGFSLKELSDDYVLYYATEAR